jgi:hypothetical protein
LPELVIANKRKIPEEEALGLARQAKRILVARGKKLIVFNTADNPDDAAIAKVILGRSGTLRAPAIRAGDDFLVGFHQEAYTEVFGS